MKPEKISVFTLEHVLKHISANNKQAIRLVSYLAENPSSITVDVNRACAIGNISDVARKINPTLFEFGLFISCRPPFPPVPNRFGERSNMFEWGIYRLPNNGEAANDAEYETSKVNS